MDNPYQFDIAIDVNIPKIIQSPKPLKYIPSQMEKLKHIFSVFNINNSNNVTKIIMNKRKRTIISFLGKRKFSEI